MMDESEPVNTNSTNAAEDVLPRTLVVFPDKYALVATSPLTEAHDYSSQAATFRIA